MTLGMKVTTEYGTRIVFNDDTDGDEGTDGNVQIDYPTVQLLPEVFVTTPGATIIAGAGSSDVGDGAAYQPNKIPAGATRLASSVSNIGAQKLYYCRWTLC